MNTQKRVLPALLLSLFAGAAATSASAAQFSNVYSFGDSLSDAGYFRGFLSGVGVPAALVPIMGRFTTNPGPVWSELVASYYGVTPAPSNAGGNIYAQGGARVNMSPGVSTPPGQAERPISTQVTEFLAKTNNVADSNALYTLWGGANDIFYNLGALQAGAITPAQLQANVLGAATAEIQQIARLQAAGAKYIAVFALPNIGGTPAFAGTANAATITALSAGYNTTLFTGLQTAGIKVIPVDTFSLFNQIIGNAAAYGFTNTTGIACGTFPPITTTPQSITSLFCYPGNTVPGGATNYVFADYVHPTSAAHAITAQFLESLIEGPTQYGLLAEAPLQARSSMVRAIGDGLTRVRTDEVGKLGVFVGGDMSSFRLDSNPGVTGMDTDQRSGTVGITMRASEAVTLGVAYGYARDKATFGNNAGGFRTGEQAWSLLGSLQWGGFYGTAVLSRGDIDYRDISRNIQLGPVTTTTSAATSGTNASAFFSAGYDFTMGRFMVGPTLAVTSQDVDVGSFDEAGGGAAGLRILSQTRKSEVWSIGARASMNLGNWTPWVRVTADRDRRDDVRLVSATPLTMLAINPVYDIPAYNLDSNYTTFALGINGLVMPNVALGISAYTVTGRQNVKDDGISGVVSIRF